MASGANESPAESEMDYLAVLNENVAKRKRNLSDQFVRIRSVLDEKETATKSRIDRLHTEKQEEIGSLQEMRSHSIALKRIMEKKSNAMQLGNVNIEESIAEIEDKLSSLPVIEEKWDLENIEKLLLNVNTQEVSVDTADDASKIITAEFEIIDCIAKGSEPSLGQLSKQLGGMITDEETGQLYIADRGNNCIQVFGRDGRFLFTISHELMVSPSSISISGKHVFVCNRKSGECNINSSKNKQNQCLCRQSYPQCKFYNQFLLKFCKKDGQIIAFTNINSSFGLISADNKSLYLYSYGYQTKFTFGINEITLNINENLVESIIRYNEIFQTEDALSLSVSTFPGSNGCLNCEEEVTPILAMQAFEDEVHLLYRNAFIKSYNLKTRLQRQIQLQNLTATIPRLITYLCWDGTTNGKLILTDSKNSLLIVVSQLGRLYTELDVRDKDRELVSPVAISRGPHSYDILSSSGEQFWMLHSLKLT